MGQRFVAGALGGICGQVRLPSLQAWWPSPQSRTSACTSQCYESLGFLDWEHPLEPCQNTTTSYMRWPTREHSMAVCRRRCTR